MTMMMTIIMQLIMIMQLITIPHINEYTHTHTHNRSTIFTKSNTYSEEAISTADLNIPTSEVFERYRSRTVTAINK